jgi:hypothetical protein
MIKWLEKIKEATGDMHDILMLMGATLFLFFTVGGLFIAIEHYTGIKPEAIVAVIIALFLFVLPLIYFIANVILEIIKKINETEI